MKKRLIEFLAFLGIGQLKFENKVGLSRGYVNSVKDNITIKTIDKIISAYPELNKEWLMSGEGEMLKSNAPAVIKLSENSIEGIPLIPIDAAAGFGKGEVQVMEFECERYVVPMFKGADFLIQVKGSSMIPKYNSGDVVACKKLPLEDIFFQWNKVYVIDTNQGPLVKRIKKGSEKDYISIISDNPQYDSFELHMSKVYGVALVIGVIRLE
ncbi:S24 family peptidase [Viscerimonas tarda]